MLQSWSESKEWCDRKKATERIDRHENCSSSDCSAVYETFQRCMKAKANKSWTVD